MQAESIVAGELGREAPGLARGAVGYARLGVVEVAPAQTRQPPEGRRVVPARGDVGEEVGQHPRHHGGPRRARVPGDPDAAPRWPHTNRV